jgi:alpha-beta hydrolase superfamily lysophospholipase
LPIFSAVRNESTFTDAEGVVIHYYSWVAAKPRGLIQIVHGLGEHALRYEDLAQQLVRAGYSVFADDHRGHGQTGLEQYAGDTTKLGKLGPGGMPATVAAVRKFTALVREKNPDLPLAAIGQSWGSIMLQIILNTHPNDVDAVVLTGTAYRAFGSMNSGNLNAKHKHLGTTGNEWLSRDPAVHQAFADDPLTFYADVIKLFGVVDGLRLMGRPAKNIAHDVPLLIMIGSEDPLGGQKSVEKLAAAYTGKSGLTDVETIIYPEARHEVFNETNRDEVIADLMAWLDARLAP